MKYRISHSTAYQYAEDVSISHHLLHIRPRSALWQEVQDFYLKIVPEPEVLTWRDDFFGNPLAFFTLQTPHREMLIEATSVMTVARPGYGNELPDISWNKAVNLLRRQSVGYLDALSYTYASPQVRMIPDIAAYAQVSFPEGRPLMEGLMHLTERIHHDFAYDPTATQVTTSVEDAFRLRRGVCQDFSHIEIAALRSLGIPARYVSGYIETVPPEGKQRFVGADASHAWVSVFLPGFGWVDVDPTNNMLATDTHLTVAWGRDYSDVSPIKGVILGGGANTLHVSVDVQRMER